MLRANRLGQAARRSAEASAWVASLPVFLDDTLAPSTGAHCRIGTGKQSRVTARSEAVFQIRGIGASGLGRRVPEPRSTVAMVVRRMAAALRY